MSIWRRSLIYLKTHKLELSLTQMGIIYMFLLCMTYRNLKFHDACIVEDSRNSLLTLIKKNSILLSTKRI